MLRRHPGLQAALLSPGPSPTAVEVLRHYSQINPDILQARLLSASGREQLRINRTPAGLRVVPADQLQNKAERDYFREGFQAPLNSLYLSALDLNREHGSVERPLQPTIRLATAIPAPSDSRKLGMLVINLNGDSLLNQLPADARRLGIGLVETMVVNEDGFFLQHGQTGRRWGFEPLAYQGRAGGCALNLRCSNPSLWARLGSLASGSVTDASGQWSWQRLDSRMLLAPQRTASGQPLRVNPRRWWLITHVPAPALERHLQTQLAPFRATGGIALALLGSLSLLAALLRRREVGLIASLHQTNANYALLAENAADVVLTLERGRIRWISASVQRYTDIAARRWIQRRALTVVHPDQRRQVLTALAQLQPHQEVRLRLQIALQPGRHEWIELFARGHAPADDNHPAPRITAGFHLINDRVRQEQQLLYLAQHDALTNLLNRRTILERLETAIAPNDQRDPHLAVLFVDLDEFKRINDSHGHAAGDLVLQETASRIQQCIRHGDSVGRLGGDELLVVLRNIHTAADAMDVAHKIHQACQRPVLYQRTSIAISVSIGVGLAQPGDSPAALQIRADQALYSAKEQGRNRVIQVKSAPP